jgi:hypothetical protein
MAGSSKEKATKAAAAESGSEIATAASAIETLPDVAAGRIDCDAIIARTNALIARRCAAKVNTLPHAGEHIHAGCNCTGGTARFAADLIVLIDASGSMSGAAAQISAAAAAAVKAASSRCDVDLRIAYMGVEGTWAGTLFTTDYLNYLKALLNPDPVFSTDSPTGGYSTEEGANAIEDLSKYYNWRPDACRAIFYISDEKLDGNTSNQAGSAAAVNQAVAAAVANEVSVFAHYYNHQPQPAWVMPQYKDLCDRTGGTAYFSATATKAEYETILAEAICGACGRPRCRAVKVPELEPCISVSWGDSKCDCFETDDTEIVCVTICNCYSNISFGNFRVAGLAVTMPDGSAVPTLPDGTPSVQIVPMGPVCFGDIPPCREDKAGCISREFVIRTRGAKGGQYQVRLIGICYDVCFHYNNQDSFTLTLCAD